jgi:hypothetical protein
VGESDDHAPDDDHQARVLPRRIEHSIRPDTAVPSTVLVADMGDGALYLASWRIGPSAYLTAQDSLGLSQELARAFGSDTVAPRDDPGQAL